MSMNILVAGATGKTGLHVARNLIGQGHKPTALVRESSDTSALPQGVDLRQGDLTDLQDGVCDGMDAVIFAAGSGGSTGPDMTDEVDRDGAKRLIDLARDAEVNRFVMLSSVGADQSDPTGDMALGSRWDGRSSRSRSPAFAEKVDVSRVHRIPVVIYRVVQISRLDALPPIRNPCALRTLMWHRSAMNLVRILFVIHLPPLSSVHAI